MKMARLNEGLSLIDGKLHSPLFIRFMKARQDAASFDAELLHLCKKHLEKGTYSAIVPVPSRTWCARLDAANAIARHLEAPLLDLLSWEELPAKRQGELLNNDQRGINVKEKMVATGTLPEGPILLIDDYIGSGATLREAARALRACSKNPILVPFTIASVKWRLGATGFV
jgi:ATP-dependent DNA helicase RecQ